MRYSERICSNSIIKLDGNHAVSKLKYIHKRNTSKTHLLQLKRRYLVLNEEERKQENKKEKLTKSLHLTHEMTRRSNYNLNPRNFAQTKSMRKPQSGSKWKTYRLSAMILYSALFNLTIQFRRQCDPLYINVIGNYANLDNRPIKITTRFSGSDG